jgi:hypothetical protein
MIAWRNLFSETVAVIMDERISPLSRLPVAQRFQVMFFLSLMWTTVFCAALGSFLFWGELVLGHALLLTAVVITSLTFYSAAKPAPVPGVTQRQ